MANPKGCYSGHGKYKPEMCARVPGLYLKGESDAEVAFALDVSKAMFYRWINQYPEFAEAVEIGKTVSECWWQKLGRDGAAGKINVQAKIFISNMKNRFGWRENIVFDPSTDIRQTVDDLRKIVQNIKDNERDY